MSCIKALTDARYNGLWQWDRCASQQQRDYSANVAPHHVFTSNINFQTALRSLSLPLLPFLPVTQRMQSATQ